MSFFVIHFHMLIVSQDNNRPSFPFKSTMMSFQALTFTSLQELGLVM